jgi:hypothetical protein
MCARWCGRRRRKRGPGRLAVRRAGLFVRVGRAVRRRQIQSRTRSERQWRGHQLVGRSGWPPKRQAKRAGQSGTDGGHGIELCPRVWAFLRQNGPERFGISKVNHLCGRAKALSEDQCSEHPMARVGRSMWVGAPTVRAQRQERSTPPLLRAGRCASGRRWRRRR